MSVKFAPGAVEEITADWLTATLGARYPGTVVTAVQHGTIIRGTATKVRLLLDYNEAGHQHRLPPTMWFKGGLEDHSLTDDMLIVYAGEAAFFNEVAATLEMDIPKAVVAAIDPTTNRSFLLLDDLLSRNASFGTALRPLSPADASVLVEELANLHAAYWLSPKLKTMGWLGGGGSLLQSCEILLSRETWERCIRLPRGEFVTPPFREFEKLRDPVLRALRTDVERAHCFVHGDSHVGNTFTTPDGSAGFLDWQSTMHGFWAHDFSYFLVTSLSIEDRRHAERDLLDRYLTVLAQQEIRLDADEAWLEHRRHAMYSCSWAMCLPEWQREDICCAVAERAFAAVEDLQTLAAWR
ncbi:MAG: phosphotransferase [Sphingomonadales bacterium]|nr:phosphotransferase [Sphingomonadales bacterium]